jgi:hypothetical protein
MADGLRENTNGGNIQGFAPSEVVEITGASQWTPDKQHRAFRVGVACNYFMNGVSAREATLVAGSITVISRSVVTYTFDTTQELEVM